MFNIDNLVNLFIQWLPNSNFTVPLELITVYTAITDVWASFPLLIRLSLISGFGICTFFCILRMLF